MNPSSYRVRGTKVTSTYPVQLTPAETRLVFSLQRHFLPEFILPDCYFLKVNSKTTQIYDSTNFAVSSTTRSPSGSELIQVDCLAINSTGIYVFESKDYSGWIYGNGKHPQWTQVLNYGQEKHHFYNPIRQNSLHIAALRDFLGNSIPIYSVIVFGRESTLKSIDDLPPSTYVCAQSNLSAVLRRIPASSSTLDVESALKLIKSHRIIPDNITRAEHITNIQDTVSYLI